MNLDPRLTITRYHSPLGPMRIALRADAVAALWFEGQRHEPHALFAVEQPAGGLARQTVEQLGEYFAGARRTFDLPLAIAAGTPFQRTVWSALREIPAGQTISYAELALRIGKPGCARAVGAAVGRNPLCIVVPCHRVIATAGGLTGYAGGLDRKRALLQLEGALH